MPVMSSCSNSWTGKSSLNRIQPTGEGEDLEDCLCCLETYDVPDIHWKQALLTAISPKLKALIMDIIMVDDSMYQDVVNALLDCSGLNCMRAVNLFLDSTEPKGKGSNLSEMIHSIFE